MFIQDFLIPSYESFEMSSFSYLMFALQVSADLDKIHVLVPNDMKLQFYLKHEHWKKTYWCLTENKTSSNVCLECNVLTISEGFESSCVAPNCLQTVY